MTRVVGFQPEVAGRLLYPYPARRRVNPFTDASPSQRFGALRDLGYTRPDGGFVDIDARAWFSANNYSISRPWSR